MKTNKVKRIIFSLCLVTIAGFGFTGCSDDDKPANNAKINMKFTVKVTGADANDQITFQAGAGNHDASQYGAPVWKINGITQGNENNVMLDEDDFLGSTKQYVVETVKPYNFGSLIVSYMNFDGGPITLSYKAEVDGKVETNIENLVITAGQSDIKNLTYKPQ